MVKCTNAATNWAVYHTGVDSSAPENFKLELNSTAARQAGAGTWDNTAPTSSDFTAGTNNSLVGQTYVAYLFASDDTNIKCGSYSGLYGSSNPLAVDPVSPVNVNNPIFINLGWAPAFVMIKCTDATNSSTRWVMYDTARGIGPYPYVSPATKILVANSADAEYQDVGIFADNNGFYVGDNSGDIIGTAGTGGVARNFIYIAIKDGATGPAPIPSGVVAATDATANTMTLASSNGTWGVNTGNWVVGPEKSVENTRLYTVLDNAGAVSDLQSNDPGFVDQASTPTQISFPSTFPTGNAPDVDLPAGTTLTAEVDATNTVGTDSATSNTITPT